MTTRVRVVIVSVLIVAATISVVELLSREPTGPRAIVCPAPQSSNTFTDARRLCASEATALARIDGNGTITYLTDPTAMPCSVPRFQALAEDMTRIVGHGIRRCDSDTAGTTLYLFPHCSLTMNYPGNEDYLEGLPIGLLVKPYDC